MLSSCTSAFNFAVEPRDLNGTHHFDAKGCASRSAKSLNRESSSIDTAWDKSHPVEFLMYAIIRREKRANLSSSLYARLIQPRTA